MKIPAIIRKSPTPSPEESIEDQKRLLEIQIKNDIGAGLIRDADIAFFIDIAKGDEEEGRVQLKKYFETINDYQPRCYCLNVDRFSRGWVGLKWFEEYFSNPEVRQLILVQGCPPLYKVDQDTKKVILDIDNYLFFFMQCAFAHWELLRIRWRTNRGRDKLRGTEEWKTKYKGRPKGAKDAKPRRTDGYFK
jgi:hypothetical protein